MSTYVLFTTALWNWLMPIQLHMESWPPPQSTTLLMLLPQ